MFVGMVHIFALTFACRTSIQEPSVEIQVRPDDEPSEEPETDTALRDVDEDGFTEDVDCDDWNPNVYPGALEILNNVDDDCDGYVDGDGLYVGSLSMTAMAIYQGQAYHFTQVCDGTLEQTVGQVGMLLTCTIDSTQERADQLLGGVIVVTAEEVFVFEQSWNGNAFFQSTGGEIEWDAQGSVEWFWSSWEENQSSELQTTVRLDALHLDIVLNGVLVRE